ncbi:APC family permease [Demequina zhanjiangensis]|uniref:APC family permease n=1 Tax=Demequina zhanjiangensis TaxID=3051659 RepID=A0ABT8FXM6_9MICO|nr:APC family permease [Demequina sp. SYSU T00b26]MDN4471658.1 APC family permease [Demequina sp. SYSU T00b26]
MTARRVGLLGATGIGVGSMLGAGVFSDMWVDVLAAGQWYLLALAIAAVVAIANALSTAQLAAAHPVAGGAYAYGRAELSSWAGHLAGAAFLVGKTASVAVGAVVLGAYVLPGHAQGIATAAIALVWALNARGITKTAWGATAIAITVSAALVVLVGFSVATPVTFGWFAYAPLSGSTFDVAPLVALADGSGGLAAVPVAAAAAFFAFAGYARIATLGEEVRDPSRTIPRAIVIALAVVLVLYVGVGVALATHVGYEGLLAVMPPGVDSGEPLTAAPLERLAEAVGLRAGFVTAVAALSVLGAMLAVLAGAGRTAMAMAREGDLPRRLAAQGRSGAPWLAELVIALAAVALVWTQGTSLLLVSVATILTYYAVANSAAFVQSRRGRAATLRIPPAVSVIGLVGCLALAGVALPAAVGEGPVWVPFVLALVVLGWPTITWLVSRRALGPKSR